VESSQSGEITRKGRMALRASSIYSVFVGGVLLSSFMAVVLVQVVSTVSGLSGGGYGLIIQTNSYGENYLELALEVAALPGSVYFFVSLKSLVEGAAETRVRERTNVAPDVPLYFGNLRWNQPRRSLSSNSASGDSKPKELG